MLIVKPVQDKDEQKKYCEECGAEFDADCLAYAAWVDEKLVGISQFRLTPNGGRIVTLRRAIGTDDLDAMFIMGRQTMNFIDLSGVHEAYYDDEQQLTPDFAQRLGFKKRDNHLWVDLNGFFESPCQHNK
ncbi:MAG: hypothetical protein HFE63_01930 [Clostridiales bacterium]|nr:hypothetical protein [Clostridiales bacterium]